MKKGLCLGLVLVLCLTLWGCSSQSGEEASTQPPVEATAYDLPAEPEADNNDYCEIGWYVYNCGITDYQSYEPWLRVEEVLRQRLDVELNLSVHFMNIYDGSQYTKYGSTAGQDEDALKLLLSAGENIDIAVSNTSSGFSSAAYKPMLDAGSWLALEELLPRYAPAVWATMPEDITQLYRQDGRLYAIPCVQKTALKGGFIYRSDWAEQVGVSSINTLQQLENYLELVQAAGLCTNPVGIMPRMEGLLHEYLYETTDMITFDNVYSISAEYMGRSQEEWWILEDIWETQETQDFLMIMRSWREKGFWETPELPASFTGHGFVVEEDAFLTGNSAVSWYGAGQYDTRLYNKGLELDSGAFPVCNPSMLQIHQPGGECKVAYLGSDGRPADKTYKNLAAIPANALHPERALQLLDFLYRDEETYRLMAYGLEGQNYTLDEQGCRVDIEPEPRYYNYLPLYSCGLGLYTLPTPAETDPAYAESLAEEDDHRVISPYDFIYIDGERAFLEQYFTDFSSIDSAFLNERTNYWMPLLLCGLSDSPMNTLSEYLAERDASGFTAYMEAYVRAMADRNPNA